MAIRILPQINSHTFATAQRAQELVRDLSNEYTETDADDNLVSVQHASDLNAVAMATRIASGRKRWSKL
jgi:hypothetical protein